VNSYLFLPFSFRLCVLPYLLRSIRIYKMFQARDIYNSTGTIPIKMIKRWSELNMFLLLLFYFVFILVINVILTYKDEINFTFISISCILNDDGLFPEEGTL
jgi:hypothetical protein